MTVTVTDPMEDIAIIPGEKHLMSIPDHTGDRRILWDPRDASDLAWAEKEFKKAKKDRKMNVYNIDPQDGTQGEPMDEFDPNAAKMMFVGATAGG